MSDREVEILQAVIKTFHALSNMMSYITVPRGMADAVTFAARNLTRLEEIPEISEQVSIETDKLERLTTSLVELTWSVLAVGQLINAYRWRVGRRPINFIEEATSYDQDKKTSQQ